LKTSYEALLKYADDLDEVIEDIGAVHTEIEIEALKRDI